MFKMMIKPILLCCGLYFSSIQGEKETANQCTICSDLQIEETVSLQRSKSKKNKKKPIAVFIARNMDPILDTTALLTTVEFNSKPIEAIDFPFDASNPAVLLPISFPNKLNTKKRLFINLGILTALATSTSSKAKGKVEFIVRAKINNRGPWHFIGKSQINVKNNPNKNNLFIASIPLRRNLINPGDQVVFRIERLNSQRIRAKSQDFPEDVYAYGGTVSGQQYDETLEDCFMTTILDYPPHSNFDYEYFVSLFLNCMYEATY